MEKLLVTFLLFFIFGSASSHNVPAIFTFGDSLFDAGNNHFIRNCSLQADFPPYGQDFFHHPTGRFTNGRTVVDFISQFLKIDLQKPFLEAEMEVVNGSRKSYPSNGVNFASAGSGVLSVTNFDSGVIPLQDQLMFFETSINLNKIDTNQVKKSLFFFESGSNDIFNYFLPFDTPQLDPESFVQTMLLEVRKFVDSVYKLGARRIGLFALGPVGCVPARVNLPETSPTRCYGKMNNMVKRYNAGLENLVREMPIAYPGTVGVYGAIYDIVQLFRANPDRYGFTNTSSACCGVGALGGFVQCGKEGYKMCDNPNKFLFWDFFHPTEHSYKLIAKALWDGKKSRIRPFNLQEFANIVLGQS